MMNQYYVDIHTHGANVFMMDWREPPWKDERWYNALQFGYVGNPMTSESIVQEVDRNYSASKDAPRSGVLRHHYDCSLRSGAVGVMAVPLTKEQAIQKQLPEILRTENIEKVEDPDVRWKRLQAQMFQRRGIEQKVRDRRGSGNALEQYRRLMNER